MSIIRDIIHAIERIERTIGLKMDSNPNPIFSRIVALESEPRIMSHEQSFEDIEVLGGENKGLLNPCTFNSLTIHDNGNFTLIGD